MMTSLTITYIILFGAAILLLSNRIRPDVVALMVMIALGISGVLTPQETFSGFSNPAVITILAIFILAEGLRLTGLTDRAGLLLVKLGGQKAGWLTTTVMTAGSLLSLFMNNIAAAAVLLPAVSGAAQKSKASPSKLLMPLAFATLLGGMATLLTTSNLIVSGLLVGDGYPGYSLTDFLPLGIPIVIIGILYIVVWGRHRLPITTPTQQLLGQSGTDLVEIYRLEERLIRARLNPRSDLVGKTLEESCLRECNALNLIAIERSGKIMLSPPPDSIFQVHDVLVLEGRPEDVEGADLASRMEIISIGQPNSGAYLNQDKVVFEAVLAPRTGLIGSSLRLTHFREKYHVNVLAIWRAGRPIRTRFSDLPLQLGDALLLQGGISQATILKTEPDLIVLSGKLETSRVDRKKSLAALIVMATVLTLSLIHPLYIGEIMLGGALAMVLLHILSMDQGYRAIDWKSIFLIAGMLPLGLAITKTGAAALVADWMIRFLGGMGAEVIIGGLIILTVLFTQVINGAVVAAIMAPIAIETAQKLGTDPRSFAMGIALAASLAFITPLGHPVNILVMGSAGYTIRDFVRIGLPLTIILLVLILILLPVFWPFYPLS